MTLYEFLIHSGFADGDRLFIELVSPDQLPDWLHGYKGTVRYVPFEFLRCPVEGYEVKDHYTDGTGVEYVSVCVIKIHYRCLLGLVVLLTV